MHLGHAGMILVLWMVVAFAVSVYVDTHSVRRRLRRENRRNRRREVMVSEG